MIRAFRRLGDTWIFKGIMVLAILSFVSLWGAGGIDNIFSPSNQAVVTMDGAEITGAELVQEFQWETNKYRKLMPMGFTYQDALSMGLLQESLYNVIYNNVMAQIVKQNDMLIPDSVVFDYIRSNPEFTGEDRMFSREKFLQVLQESNLSEQEFIKIAKNDVLANYVLDTNRAFPYAPEQMLEMIQKQRLSKRDAILIDIKTSNVQIPSPPTDDELQGYYEENQDNYMTPEYRDFEMAVISYKDIIKNINVPEDELKEIFEAEKDSLDTQETRYLNGLMFEAKDIEKAQTAISELKSKEKDFKRVAMEKLFQFENEWDWGYIAKDFLPDDLKEPVFNAKKGEVLGPINGTDGKIYIIQVTEISPFKEATFKEKKDELLMRVKKERSEELTYELIEAIEEDVSVNTSIKDIANKHGLEYSSYKNKMLEDKKIDEAILGTVYSLEEDEISGVMDYKDGIFVVRNNTITEPKLKGFASVKKQVRNALESQIRSDIAATMVQDIVNSANEKGLTQVIRDKKLKTRSIKNVGYEDEDNKSLSKTDITKLFELSKGEAYFNPTADGYVVVGLGKINASNEKVALATKSKIKNNLEDSIIKSMEQQFYMDYASELNVQTHQGVIESTFKALLRN